jgi:hypothetical protein
MDARSDRAADALGPPPSGDFECTKPWNSPPASADPACFGVRTVSLVEATSVTTGGIGIARTSSGYVGIVYDYADDADSIGLHIASFLAPATSMPLSASIVTIGLGIESDLGIPSSVVADPSADVFHLVYADDDAQELLYQQVAAATGALTSTELIASGIGSGAYASVAVSTTGVVRAAYYVPSTGSVRSASRNSGGGFATPSEVVTGLDPNANGTGEVSLVFDDQGTPNLLYQQCEVNNFSTPEYATFDGTAWSEQKTIDNAILNGYAGYSPGLAVSGATKYAAYYFIQAGQAVPATAELHVATWQLETDQPQIAILDTAIPANDPTGTDELFRFQAALTVDNFGLLHMVVVRPYDDNQSGSIEYMRQAVVGGSVKWLSDVIDDDAFAPSLDDLSPNAFVAIVVDDEARPHIAYRSGKDSSVYYATRFDR